MLRHHNHVQQTPMQRNRVMPPIQPSQPQMLMTVPAAPHPGVIVSMMSAPPMKGTGTVPQPATQQHPVLYYDTAALPPQGAATVDHIGGVEQQQAVVLPATVVTTASTIIPNQDDSATVVHVAPASPTSNTTTGQTSAGTGAASVTVAATITPVCAGGTNNCTTTVGSHLPHLANMKEKTPMCLVNELARYNKIQHQYRLTNEEGPAHKKIFTVTLKLGNEEYEAEGASIKKAQHSAAAQALTSTQLKHPPPKTVRINRQGMMRNASHVSGGMVTPTVELNALAMKRGERTVYIVESGGQPHAQMYYTQGYMGSGGGGGSTSGGYYPRPHNMYATSGVTGQQAAAPPQPVRISYDDRRMNGGQVQAAVVAANVVPHHHQPLQNNSAGAGHHHHIRPTYNNYKQQQQLYITGTGGYNSKSSPQQQQQMVAPQVGGGSYGQGQAVHSGAADICTVKLRVGEREYPGSGPTVQAAKHDAATKAIDEIKRITVEETVENRSETEIDEENGVITDLSVELKSPISLVYEIALKRHMSIAFEVLSEKGPPHMKVFVTRCSIGDLVVDGEGNGKKVSKKRAAEKMLEQLGKFGPLTTANAGGTSSTANGVQNGGNFNAQQQQAQMKRKRVVTKKKIRNLIKVNAEKTTEFPEDINPISRLIQIQQANKEKEPVYTLMEERGAPRRREFIIQAMVSGFSCKGMGPNKKIAKRNAAQGLLNTLGYPTAPAAPAQKPAKSEKEESNEKPRKVTFQEEKPEPAAVSVGGFGGRQLVPGLLLVTEQTAHAKPKQSNETTGNNAGTTSPTAAKPAKTTSTVISNGIRAKDKLMYLAQLLEIQVQFSDFPKANHDMYLTLVSLSTTPPQVCHGEGPTTEASQEKASNEALNVLSELGLDIVAPPKESPESTKSPQATKSNSTLNQNGVKK